MDEDIAIKLCISKDRDGDLYELLNEMLGDVGVRSRATRIKGFLVKALSLEKMNREKEVTATAKVAVEDSYTPGQTLVPKANAAAKVGKQQSNKAEKATKHQVGERVELKPMPIATGPSEMGKLQEETDSNLMSQLDSVAIDFNF